MSVEESDDSKKFNKDYDILNMLNSISNFEVFTPFEVADSMVKLLPEEVFTDPNFKFLDPAVKSGIFLREIIYKLDIHLPRTIHTDKDTGKTYDLNNRKERTNHILRNMIYGIAISELTSYVTRRTIYGVMEANVDKSVEYLNSKQIANKLNITETGSDLDFNAFYDHTMFNTEERKGYEKEGNIFYPADETTISTEDTHHPFINETQHPFINQIKEGKMKFDVIIGNPPYQRSDGGHGASASPIYHIFIERAVSINPRYISMITPARWYSGGKGLDEFRSFMSTNKNLVKIVDFTDSKECFSNVEIKGGVSYFLIDNKYSGKCLFLNIKNGVRLSSFRYLDEFGDFIIRDNKSIDIIKKFSVDCGNNLSDFFSSRNPFGIPTNFSDFSKSKNDNKIFANKTVSHISYCNIKKIHKSINMFKVFIPKASDGKGSPPFMVLGKPISAGVGDVCTDTYLVAGYFKDFSEAKNYSGYLKTKSVRFLISMLKNTQDLTKGKVSFVPNLPMDQEWTDEILYKKYNLTEDEIKHIEETIRPME